MPNRILIRRGTAASWASLNPVLMVGEQGLEIDTGRTKFGDGVTPWSALAHHGAPKVGAVQYFAENPGAGWLECNMGSVLRSDYPALSALLPTHGWDRSTALANSSGAPAPNFSYSVGYSHNGTVFVKDATGSNGHMWSSPDGVTWTKLVDFLPFNSYSVGFSSNATGSIMVAVATGSSAGLAYSLDGGMSWALPTTNVSNSGANYPPIWDGAYFRSGSKQPSWSAPSGNYQIYSTNGSDWVKAVFSGPAATIHWDVISPSAWDGYAYAHSLDKQWVLCSYENSVEYSLDPTSILKSITAESSSMIQPTERLNANLVLGLAPGGNLAVGDGSRFGGIYASGDLESSAPLVAITKFSGLFMALSASGGILVSADGYKWSQCGEGLHAGATNPYGHVVSPSFISVIHYAKADSVPRVTTLKINPLKMLLPSIPEASGMKPYVYALDGAGTLPPNQSIDGGVI